MFVFIINTFKQKTVQNENRHNTVIRTMLFLLWAAVGDAG